MKDKCRMIVTTECLLRCPYCVNRKPEIQDKFKMKTYADIGTTLKYKVWNLTGGEPLLAWSKLKAIVDRIRGTQGTDTKIYLYTTGLIHLTWPFAKQLDGVTFGYHGQDRDTFASTVKDTLEDYKELSVRISIENKVYKEEQEFFDKLKVPIIIWVMDVCTGTDEDWVIV